MRNSIIYILFALLPVMAFSQGASPRLKIFDIKVYADSEDWTATKIMVKKGDVVMFQASGTVDLGSSTQDISALGSINPFLIYWNRFNQYQHGVLISMNDDVMVHARPGEVLRNKPGKSTDRMLSTNPVPLILNSYLMSDGFIGNYFVSKNAQELKFIVNDRKLDDNKGFFSVKVFVYSLLACPDLDGKFDLACYIDSVKGVVPFSVEDDCKPRYGKFQRETGGLWFEGRDDEGHCYLAINYVGNFSKSTSEAMGILKNNIYYIFPYRAVESDLKENIEKSKIELGHSYNLTYGHTGVLTPVVQVTKLSAYHFTFNTLHEKSSWHPFKGTAVHGVFRDKNHNLYMFQQGRGVPDESWKPEELNQVLADLHINYEVDSHIMSSVNLVLAPIMWETMAANMRELL